MEPIVASLWSSFGRVPPVAIPAMLDCLLASTAASPSSLIFHLLNEYPKLSKGITHKRETMDSELHNSVAAYVAALCHLVKKSGPDNMHIVVWTMWIPLMKLVYPFDRELFSEVVNLFLNVVAETNKWEVLEATVVPLLLRSIGLSMGMVQNEQFAIYKWSENSTFEASKDNEVIAIPLEDFHDKSMKKYSSEDFLECSAYDFSLSISCNILILTLEAALRNKYERVASESTLANAFGAKSFVGNVIWDLSSFTLQMLLETLEHRSISIRFVLPFIFKAFAREDTFRVAVPGMSHTITRNDFFRKIWKCCKLLFSLGSLERRDAYDILSLYLSLPSLSSELEDVNVDGKEEMFDLRADQEFWDELKRGLLDKESLLRKQSLHILKTTLNLNKERKCYSDILEETSNERGSNSHTMTKKGRWADQEAQSLGVGRLCNNNELSPTGWYRWEAFVFLYEMLEEYGTHLVEATWNHQIMLLLRSSFPLENSMGSIDEEELYYNRMATAEQIFEWLTILWERGFCHDNPQVRCLIMQSFLSIKWENYECCAKVVPKNFILGPLMQGLNDPAHHREFGIKEIYSSRTIQAVARFLCSYASYMEGRQHILFLVDLSSISKTHSFGRAGLMCLVECIASAACTVAKHNDCDIEHFIDATTDHITVETAPNSCQIDRANLLDVFRFILDCSKQHFNPKYRHQVCEKVLAAAAAVMTGNDVPLETLLHFISSLPRECTDYGGSLRCVVQKWLQGPDLQLLKAIYRLPRKFLSFQHQLDPQFTYDDEDLEAWGSEAKRWARVLFLAVHDMEHFDPILKFIQDHGGDVCNMKNHPESVGVKFLILVYNMVDELQIIQERKTIYRVTRGVGGDLDTPGMIDNLSCMGESIIFDKFTVVLLSFLDQLISFTKSSCSVFWSDAVTETMILPGSIRGKLGGPSQRRLSTSLCTSVLEAITSVKTLSSVLRWCAQFNTHGLINSSQSFLWNFCWKTITTSAPKSEVEAEIRIASYEACGNALMDLVSIFSPLALDLVTDNDNSVPLQRDDKALLDVFVSTFIHNINNIIDGGNLTRTRRAILMNCKWSCLESLLSLPNHAINNGVHLKACTYFFSEKIVPHIFDDLVESLENAGEASVLPLLRSVRLTVELFNSRKSEPSISRCGGITVEKFKVQWVNALFHVPLI